MRERVRNVLVGACTVGALAAGATLFFLFGEIAPLFQRRWTLEVVLNEAGGLRQGSLVTMNGVPIGSVDLVRFDPTNRDNPVAVLVAIEDSVELPSPSAVSVQTSLLGSGARLEFTAQLPLSSPPQHYARDGSARLIGSYVPLERRFVKEFEPRLEEVWGAFAELKKLAGNLNGFVQPPADGAAPDPESLRGMIARLNRTMESADRALASAQSWLDDPQLRTDIRDTAHGANELMRDAAIAANRVGNAAESIGNAATALQADAAALRAEAVPALDSLGAAFEELNRLLAAARAGDGTVGRLMKDPALYESLTDSARRLESLLERAELLLEKIRAEGLDVELFK
jgi:phospholipid/cholesterol/gamma-HCH transport system substrate-binding protein